MNTAATRREHDFLGELRIPASDNWGVHTARAIDNFPISGQTIARMPELVRALAYVKKAAAQTNGELGVITAMQAQAIVRACDDVIGGALHEEFVVDVIQGGAGTSTNMNANEVICNPALELLGHKKDEYQHLHPLDHVNLSQSTNDVYPTAIKLALNFGIKRLLVEMASLRNAFAEKAKEFDSVL